MLETRRVLSVGKCLEERRERLLPLVNGMPVPREKVDPQQDPGAKGVLLKSRTRVSISQSLRIQ